MTLRNFRLLLNRINLGRSNKWVVDTSFLRCLTSFKRRNIKAWYNVCYLIDRWREEPRQTPPHCPPCHSVKHKGSVRIGYSLYYIAKPCQNTIDSILYSKTMSEYDWFYIKYLCWNMIYSILNILMTLNVIHSVKYNGKTVLE